MRSNIAVENLESRRLLAYTTNIYDPSVGMIDSEIKTSGYRAEKVMVPQVSSDGTVTVNGTSANDIITVTRVSNPLADKNDGEYDFAKYTDMNGEPVWSSGEIDQYVSTEWLEDERTEMAYYTRERDALIAAGRPVPAHLSQQIARYEKSIAHGQNFLDKFESGKFIRITLEGIYDWFYELSDEQAANARVVINGGAGKDNISISTNVPLKGLLNGGAGSDTLTSGKKLSRLNGGNGNDKLISRSVKGGHMDGGAGADRYYNRAATAEIPVVAKNDGDRISTPLGLVPVKTTGLFGTLAVNATTVRSTYKVDSNEGPRDILA